jgi:hypothetical protein
MIGYLSPCLHLCYENIVIRGIIWQLSDMPKKVLGFTESEFDIGYQVYLYVFHLGLGWCQ